MRTLTVICPVFNEEPVIARFHAELSAVLRGLSEGWRTTVLFVVDGSTDGTLEHLRTIAAADPCVRVIALSNRFGRQMALLAGLDHCDSDAVVMMMATCSTRPPWSRNCSPPSSRASTSSTPCARTSPTSPGSSGRARGSTAVATEFEVIRSRRGASGGKHDDGEKKAA